MDTTSPTDSAATVIIGQHVRPGSEDSFAAWQHELNKVASHYPGFIGAEVTAPTAVQPDWVVVYRFDSIANVTAWINSAARQDRLAVGQKYLDRPPTQHVVGGAAKRADQLVTVVVSHRVPPENVDEFLEWQQRLLLAEREFSGFRGSEIFRPIEGVQDEWTAMYRYDNAAALETWLASKQRRELLAEGEKFHDFEQRTVDNSFGSWFAFDEHGDQAPPPSDIKTSVAVWVGVYPTVVVTTLALAPLHMPFWLSLLIGNLISSFVLSFVTMPYYVNPLLKHWLRPPPDESKFRNNLRGLGISAVALAVCAVLFYLVTIVFWHLP